MRKNQVLLATLALAAGAMQSAASEVKQVVSMGKDYAYKPYLPFNRKRDVGGYCGPKRKTFKMNSRRQNGSSRRAQ